MTPENIRCEVIQTTCSQHKQLNTASPLLLGEKTEAFKKWAELIYSEMCETELHTVSPGTLSSKQRKTQEPQLAKKDVIFLILFLVIL